MSSGVEVRQAVFADLEAIAPLFDSYRQFYGQAGDIPAARAFLRERFEHGESVVFLAEEAGKAVGFTQLFPSFSSVSICRIFILNDLYVTPSARRHGAGAKLLGAAAAYSRSMGAKYLSLATAIDNLPGQALYEANGWIKDESFYVYHLMTNV